MAEAAAAAAERRPSFGRLATSRKAEEAARRRHLAAAWLDSLVGPLGLPPGPSESEFVAALRNGIVLCRAVNWIRPNAVPKIVQVAEAASAMQPLPAYQYFENIHNFLSAVKELKLPGFEASDLEEESVAVGSASKIVDCILSIKAYHECDEGSSTSWTPKQLRSLPVTWDVNQKKCLHMTAKLCKSRCDDLAGEDALESLCRALTDHILNSPGKRTRTILVRWSNDRTDAAKSFGEIISTLMEQEKFGDKLERTQLTGVKEDELAELKSMHQKIRTVFHSMHIQLKDDLKRLEHEIGGLSTAALAYNQAANENRRLYNIIQELKGNIRVFCRVRPPYDASTKCLIQHIADDGSLMILDSFKSQTKPQIFRFNKVFGPNAAQGEVYQEIKPLTRSVMDGYNVCIIAYGPSGSGKTYTMFGPTGGSSKEVGIYYKALDDLFCIANSRRDTKYSIHIQMVEIYNEQVYDLLSEDRRACLINDQLGILDAKMQTVVSANDARNILKIVETKLACNSAAMNHQSSRPHCLATVHIHAEDSSGSKNHSCLRLVDIAGSGSVDRTDETGQTLKDALHSNKSLSSLEDVIMALAQKSTHVPYSNVKLTQLLQSSLGGNAKMLIFAHVGPEAASYSKTISTLKFAQMASSVELGSAQLNTESREIREMKEQIEILKKALECRQSKNYSSRLKENTPLTERSEQVPDLTPPRSQRSSMENTSCRTPTISRKREDVQRHGKSPISQLRSAADTAKAHEKSSSTDFTDKSRIRLRTNDPQMPQEPPKEKNGTTLKIIDTASMCHLPMLHAPDFDSKQVTPEGLKNAMNKINRPDDNSENSRSATKSINCSANKRMQLTKSIQSIGSLTNYGKRNIQTSVESTTARANIHIKQKQSPIINSHRPTRRQSLANVQPESWNISRRSSLGGRSDASTNNVRAARTPPPAPLSTREKRWL